MFRYASRVALALILVVHIFSQASVGVDKRPVAVINANVVREDAWSLTVLGFMAAAVKLSDTLKDNPKVLWAEFTAGYEPFVEYFKVDKERAGDVIASISVWSSLKDAQDFIASAGHAKAAESYLNMFEPDKSAKLAFYIEPLPKSANILTLSRPRYFVEKALSKQVLREKLEAGVSKEGVFDPRTGPTAEEAGR